MINVIDSWITANIQLVFAACFIGPLAALLLFNLGVVHDRQQERCLPWAWYFKNGFVMPQKGEYAMLDGNFVRSHYEQNQYFKKTFIGKQLVASAGDVVEVNSEGIFVNDELMASGLPLAQKFYQVDEHQFYKTYLLEEGEYFFLGTHPLSNDSRYFGPVHTNAILAKITPLI